MRLATFASLAFALAVPSTEATTWFVAEDGSGDAPTIQAAVDSSAVGDEILIGPGTFGEEVTVPHALTVRGQMGAESTIIDAEGLRAHCIRYLGGAGSTDIEGLTLTGVTAGYGFCTGVSALSVSPNAGGLSVDECIIRNIGCPENHAPLEGAGVLILQNTVFRDCFSGSPCGGIDPGNGEGAVQWNGPFVLIAGCTFENCHGPTTGAIRLSGFGSQFIVGDCTFAYNGSTYSRGLFQIDGQGNTFSATGSLFVGNDGMPLLTADQPQAHIGFSGNTMARNRDFFTLDPVPFPAGSILRRNVFSGSDVGLALPNGGAGLVVECNDSWGNHQNWSGFDPAAVGPDNFSARPLYCDPDNDVFTVATGSPLLPSHSPCDLQVGAFGEGCGPVSVQESSWAEIKGRYRE